MATILNPLNDKKFSPAYKLLCKTIGSNLSACRKWIDESGRYETPEFFDFENKIKAFLGETVYEEVFTDYEIYPLIEMLFTMDSLDGFGLDGERIAKDLSLESLKKLNELGTTFGKVYLPRVAAPVEKVYTYEDLSHYICEDAKRNSLCRNLDCPKAVFQVGSRWFISMGHSGFNSPANNRDGYASQKAALAAFHRYVGKGKK